MVTHTSSSRHFLPGVSMKPNSKDTGTTGTKIGAWYDGAIQTYELLSCKLNFHSSLQTCFRSKLRASTPLLPRSDDGSGFLRSFSSSKSSSLISSKSSSSISSVSNDHIATLGASFLFSAFSKNTPEIH